MTDELDPVKPLPRTREIPIPELGEDAFFTMINPWLLPEEDIPIRPPVADDDWEGKEKLRKESRERQKRRLAVLIPNWRGITDTDGNELPAPREDPEVLEKLPQVISAKLFQALDAMELDMAWDPTRRPPKPPAPPTAPKTDSPMKSESSSESPTTSEPTEAGAEQPAEASTLL